MMSRAIWRISFVGETKQAIVTPLDECERRDVKGLYARARRGEVKDFTGISAPFEAPTAPDLSLDTSQMTLKEEVEAVVELCLQK